ncbi:MAG: carbohydrate kinase family protein [Blautia sp.]|nr:carbohydrate kinase family protein [Blautia sp.]
MGIVVIGSVFVDIKGYPLAQYIPAGRNAGRVQQVHGGVSRNLVEDIANIDLHPTFVSLVDDTGLGTDVLERLRRHHVNTDYIRRVPDGMGTWLAVFDNNGDVVASISRRPDLTGIMHILQEQGDEIFQGADSIAIEVDIEDFILEEVLRLAEKYGKDVYGLVSNMSIALERRGQISRIACFVCNLQEAGLFFAEDYSSFSKEQLLPVLQEKIRQAGIRRMVVTMGDEGAVYASLCGELGMIDAPKVDVIDTTGCGDAFCAGVTIGLTYGKTLAQACEIGTRIAASVIATEDSVCPRFKPGEFGLDILESRDS